MFLSALIAFVLAFIFNILFLMGLLVLLIVAFFLWAFFGGILFFRDLGKKKPVSKLKNRTFLDEGLCVVKLVFIPQGQEVQTIKILRDYFDWDLARTKDIVCESYFPVVLSSDMPLYKAEELQEECEWAGVVVEIYKI